MIDIDAIRDSLLMQLKTKRADVAVLREQVESYCRFARLEDEMWEDIAKNGKNITVTAASTGKKGTRENPAVKMAMMASKQKLDILKRLNLDIDTIIDGSEDEDSDI